MSGSLTEAREARTNGIDGLLQRFRFTDARAGVLCGEETQTPKSRRIRDAAIRASHALTLIVSNSDILIPKLRVRIGWVRRFQILGQALTIVGSATVLASLAQKNNNVALLVGVATLLGSLINASSSWLNGTFAEKRTLQAAFEQIVESRATAIGLQHRLDLYDVDDLDDSQAVNEIVSSINALSGQYDTVTGTI